MRIPGALVALLLLGEALSQSKRNSKANVKIPAHNQKSPNPSAAEEDAFVGVLPPLEDDLALQLRSASLAPPWHAQKAPEDMKLFFLKNSLDTCNDGTRAGAGGTGMLLNLERVVTRLEMLGAETVKVRGLVDSGWFLDLKHPRQSDCSDAASSAPAGAIKKGLRMWKGILPEKCKLQFKRVDEWQCFLGYRLYSSLKSPVFVVQCVFDKEQLRLENIHLGSQSLTEIQWNYLKNLGRELSNSQCAVSAVFAPACLSHTLITKSYWLEFQVKGNSLARALQCWEKSLQSSNKAPKICMRSCPFHLIDNCPWPHCNPTCSALHDHGIGHEVNFLQALFRMRPDVHRKAQELKPDPS